LEDEVQALAYASGFQLSDEVHISILFFIQPQFLFQPQDQPAMVSLRRLYPTNHRRKEVTSIEKNAPR
jgi:hypothetical protein